MADIGVVVEPVTVTVALDGPLVESCWLAAGRFRC